MKKVHAGGWVSFYIQRARMRYVLHFTPEQYACRHAVAKRLVAFRKNSR